MQDEFTRTIKFRHGSGTEETLTLVTADDGCHISLTQPASTRPATAWLNASLTEALLRALIDIQDANERIAHRQGRTVRDKW